VTSERPPIGRGTSSLKEALLGSGLRPRKSLGQNFLVDLRALDAVAAAAELRDGDVILEIGPGPGVLTERLVGAGRRVIACEIDEDLLAFARERLPGPDIEWVAGDAIDGRGRFSPRLESALRAAVSPKDPGGTPSPWKLVSNLPYAISVPAVLLSLAFDPPPERVVVTVQREVGDRFRAEPSTKDFGAVTVLSRLMSDIDVVRKLSPGSFWPAPQVRSIVLRFRSRCEDESKLAASNDFQRFVRDCFSERRKQLAPLLQTRSDGRVAAGQVGLALGKLGFSPLSRADALPPFAFASLFRSLWAPYVCGCPNRPPI
jgi:16S rRNA (adenine1518-N6/adenine1519-N6)-dimethyltransferase